MVGRGDKIDRNELHPVGYQEAGLDRGEGKVQMEGQWLSDRRTQQQVMQCPGILQEGTHSSEAEPCRPSKVAL